MSSYALQQGRGTDFAADLVRQRHQATSGYGRLLGIGAHRACIGDAVALFAVGNVRADAGYYPLAVANAVLGSGQNGRLFQEVRAKRGLSYGAYSSLGARAEGGALVASTQTKNESAAEVVGLVLAEFDRLAREPVAAQAVTDRETFITGGFQRSLETTGGLGGLLADAVVNGLPLSESETYPQKIAATTPDSLREAAGIVSAEDAVVVVVGQADMFIDDLRAAHPEVVVIPAAELDLQSPTLGM